ESSPSQTPTKSTFNQVGDWVIARSTRQPSVRLLPEELQAHLKSEEPLDRFGALIDLRDLIEGPNPRLAEAAIQAVTRLTEDDSRRVAAAARRLLDEETARPRPATRRVRRRGASPLLAPTAEVSPDVPPASIAPDVGSPTLERRAVPLAAPPAPSVPDLAPPAPTGATSVAGSLAAPTPSVQPARTNTGSAQAGADASADRAWWSLGRAAARAALGSFLGVLIQFIWLLVANQEFRDDSTNFSIASTYFTGVAFFLVIVAAVVVSVAERQIPAVRLPRGTAYQVVGGNRWLASGIVGAIVGLTVGLIVEGAVLGAWFGKWQASGPEVVLCTALGFVVAEAIVGRRFGNVREEQSAA
ncbi:MAG TPA: hypothetical protein VGQ89_11190, partial [Candidatus Limnocylindrales bacterium]|nr:hypothetical protein [Candidatus Limnocylindrales bacterium]